MRGEIGLGDGSLLTHLNNVPVAKNNLGLKGVHGDYPPLRGFRKHGKEPKMSQPPTQPQT